MDDKKTKQNQQSHSNGQQSENGPHKEIEQLRKELEGTKKQVEELKHKYLRALADYQNYEQRMGDEKAQLIKSANTGLILKLLPFLDNLDKAEIFFKDQGLKMIKEQFHKTLKETGLEEIEVMNKEFDPYVAEVVDIVEGDKDNIIVEVLRKGYGFNGKILRVAQVKVSKKKTIQKSE